MPRFGRSSWGAKWAPSNKWVSAQGVFATGLVQIGFENGTNEEFWKFGMIWFIQALVSYLVSNKRLPDENS
jgi:hypothetical protein